MARPQYVWQQPGWPRLVVAETGLAPALASARREQGKAMGLFLAVGLAREAEVTRDVWTGEAIATAAIEGEKLELESVRSSIMRRLGMDARRARASRQVDGLLDVMQDAVESYAQPLDEDRLYRWHSALFPGGTSGIRRIVVGGYRTHEDPTQIVSGPVGRERAHYEAPESRRVPAEMRRFLRWWREPPRMDGIVRAAVAHLWFETVHPFEDGNGRIGRALVDMALAQDTASPRRFYSLSQQLMAQRREYYDALNRAQRGPLDVTPWAAFFVEQFRLACVRSQGVIASAIEKSHFWMAHAELALNERQRKAVKRLLDAGDGGFVGGMTAEKYSHLTGASKATATRDLVLLLRAGMLIATGQGRGTRYWINVPGWTQRPAG